MRTHGIHILHMISADLRPCLQADGADLCLQLLRMALGMRKHSACLEQQILLIQLIFHTILAQQRQHRHHLASSCQQQTLLACMLTVCGVPAAAAHGAWHAQALCAPGDATLPGARARVASGRLLCSSHWRQACDHPRAGDLPMSPISKPQCLQLRPECSWRLLCSSHW